MPAKTHPTRQLLLDAGLVLAEHAPLSGIAIDEIVKEAGVAKGTFYVHFSDRTEFLVALHDQFHDELRGAVAAVALDLPAGGSRLKASTVAYLDGCLDARGVKAMLVHARGEPAIAGKVMASNARFAKAAAADFRALGVKHPLESARLFVAMTAEIALLELEAGGRQPKLRAALWDFLSIAPD